MSQNEVKSYYLLHTYLIVKYVANVTRETNKIKSDRNLADIVVRK